MTNPAKLDYDSAVTLSLAINMRKPSSTQRDVPKLPSSHLISLLTPIKRGNMDMISDFITEIIAIAARKQQFICHLSP
jgi:hypothetical protein